LCERYRIEILSYNLAGPIVLVGHSFGGHVALELGCLLHEAGLEIERVILLDSAAQAPRSWSALDDVSRLRAYLQGVGLPMATDTLQDLSRDQAAALVLESIAAARAGFQDGSIWLRAVLDSAAATGPMLANWTPRAPRAPVHLLRAKDEAGLRTPDLSWSTYFPLSSIESVPGDHFNLLSPPHVATTAAAILGLLSVSPSVTGRGESPE
jgi:thioesterase domain-containing protein